MVSAGLQSIKSERKCSVKDSYNKEKHQTSLCCPCKSVLKYNAAGSICSQITAIYANTADRGPGNY